MQTNDSSVAPTAATSDAASSDSPAETEVAPRRKRRRREPLGVTQMVQPRFTPAEREEVDAAAASAGMSRSRFLAEAALAAARGTPMVLAVAQDREALVRLQRQLFAARTEVGRFGTNVNQAVRVLNRNGEAPEYMYRWINRTGFSIVALDEVIAEVDRRLR
jgi:uncharacterized protein (DUF1778 family)